MPRQRHQRRVSGYPKLIKRWSACEGIAAKVGWTPSQTPRPHHGDVSVSAEIDGEVRQDRPCPDPLVDHLLLSPRNKDHRLNHSGNKPGSDHAAGRMFLRAVGPGGGSRRTAMESSQGTQWRHGTLCAGSGRSSQVVAPLTGGQPDQCGGCGHVRPAFRLSFSPRAGRVPRSSPPRRRRDRLRASSPAHRAVLAHPGLPGEVVVLPRTYAGLLGLARLRASER